jgi:predicted DNA-binding antitoxin AbrB/MazE fold protein
MSKIIDAIYENGVFRPLIKIKLPEHKKLKIIIADKTASTKSKKKCSLKGIIDIAKDCPDTDLSSRHDKYLYGEAGE